MGNSEGYLLELLFFTKKGKYLISEKSSKAYAPIVEE